MAWGRKKGGGRKEPRFGLAAAMADLRLDPKDRIQVAEDDTPKTSA
ncbi:MAG: penicillin-binding protein, partial [Bradyrhizobium sp.]